MRVRAHIAATAVFGGLLYYIFRSIPMLISVFLSGVLIDLDHVLDCYLNFGRKFNVWNTINVCENLQLKKTYLFLHSYELLLIYSFIVRWLNLGPVWFGIATGLTFHILLDRMYNYLYPNSLFFIARLKVNFEASKIVDIEAQRIHQIRK